MILGSRILLILSYLLFSSWAMAASSGLIIHAVEIGVAKFHREDNKHHPYATNNAWTPFILPDSANSQTPLTIKNPDGSVSIFFSTLQELLESSVKASQNLNQKIQVLNINGHGMPGGMWFPKNEKTKNSMECYEWRSSAGAPDSENYNQYYSAVSKSEIMQIRQLSDSTSGGYYPCVTGLKEWQDIVPKVQDLKTSLADNVQIHFFSCVVGLGARGNKFTQGIAQLMLSPDQGRVESSLKFGLGDWSMPDGMAFWDYIDDQQLSRDNEIYPKNKKDSDIQQTGDIRVASLNSARQAISGLIVNADYMFAGMDHRQPQWGLRASSDKDISVLAPATVRIPGTNVTLKAKTNSF